VERAEAKVFANRERYKNYFITKPLRRAYGKLFTFSGNYQDTPRTSMGILYRYEYRYIYIYVHVHIYTV
jgi:hypothetical protein